MINNVTLVGRLTKDADLKYTQSGMAVASFTVAVDRMPDKDGNKKADFIPIVVWGKTAEATAQYTAKGSLVGIVGRIQTRNYEDKNGVKRYVTEIVANEIKFLSRKSDSSSSAPDQVEEEVTFTDEDIPF